ncbi:MAG: hypothetical protein QOH49_3567 [Acidobacteriota bacterium]|jgi:hypothetical protein|nr:hypothetical protein [Acidobacteriota bacterium]
MLKNEFEGISEEDMEDFKALLVQFYGKPWEESYALFTKEIAERLGRKDTNRKYRSPLSADEHDLVMSVVARFIKINSKLRRAETEIVNFYAMLENRIDHVHHEELRHLSKLARTFNVDDIDIISQAAPIDREMEESEASRIAAECYNQCLGKLPKHILDIYLEYYDVEGLTPAERTEARRRLALRVAGLSPSEATLEATGVAKKNLDIMLSKWRRKNLALCKAKCVEEHTYVDGRPL